VNEGQKNEAKNQALGECGTENSAIRRRSEKRGPVYGITHRKGSAKKTTRRNLQLHQRFKTLKKKQEKQGPIVGGGDLEKKPALKTKDKGS